jgi:hypothetical protein
MEMLSNVSYVFLLDGYNYIYILLVYVAFFFFVDGLRLSVYAVMSVYVEWFQCITLIITVITLKPFIHQTIFLKSRIDLLIV